MLLYYPDVYPRSSQSLTTYMAEVFKRYGRLVQQGRQEAYLAFFLCDSLNQVSFIDLNWFIVFESYFIVFVRLPKQVESLFLTNSNSLPLIGSDT